MFTRSDLATLTAQAPTTAVSIFLPTHPASSDRRQDPIRLKNLLARARDLLVAQGHERNAADALLEPATSLVDDHPFWQAADHGLALFLSDDGTDLRFTVPLELTEDVVVGRRFHVAPLLPLLEGDGTFYVLTVTASHVCLYQGTRFALEHLKGAELPESVRQSLGETDYENPVNASPSSRPHTGSANTSNAQVYGDSPREWRKTRLVEFASRVSARLDQELGGTRRPIVLVAMAELAGQLKEAHAFDAAIELNPESLSATQLREASYTSLRGVLDATRSRAIDRYNELYGRGDSRVSEHLAQIVDLAEEGRVEVLLVGDRSPDSTEWTDADPTTGSAGEQLSAAISATFVHGGDVHKVPQLGGATDQLAGAILRY